MEFRQVNDGVDGGAGWVQDIFIAQVMRQTIEINMQIVLREGMVYYYMAFGATIINN